MLMTPMTPKVMASPMAASSSTEPSEIPYQAFCTASQTARRFLMAAIAAAAASHDRRRGIGRQAGEQPERVLVAALADHVDGRELVFIAGLVAEQDDRGARFDQRALDPRILLLGDRGFERRQRAGFARLEHRLRGVEALVGIGGQQRQAAERRVDRAAQPVVEADGIEIGRRVAGDRLAGRGIEQLAGIGLDVDRLVLGAEHQPAVLQGANDGLGPRVAARGDLVDAGDGLAEIVGGEMGERSSRLRGMRGGAARARR